GAVMTGGAGPCTVRARGAAAGPRAFLLRNADDSAAGGDAHGRRLAADLDRERAAGGVAVRFAQLRAAGRGAGEAVLDRVGAGSDGRDVPGEGARRLRADRAERPRVRVGGVAVDRAGVDDPDRSRVRREV